MNVTRGRWQRFGLILVVALLTVTSFAALVHRHIGSGEPGCVLCQVRQEPGLDNPIARVLPAPAATERALEIAQIELLSRDSVPVRSGRAPPISF